MEETITDLTPDQLGWVSQTLKNIDEDIKPRMLHGIYYYPAQYKETVETLVHNIKNGVYTGVSIDAVRQEASRRMRLLLGARDEKHLGRLISNGSRRAIELQSIRLGVNEEAREWTSQEKAEAEYLSNLSKQIDSIREFSNTLEDMYPGIPANFEHDDHWK